MGKYENTKKRKPRKWIGAVCLLILVGLAVFFIMPQVLYRMNEEPESAEVEQILNGETGESNGPEYEMSDTVAFPVNLADGKVEIESLFSFNGINPDSHKQEAVDTAAIILRNTADTHLRDAKVTATLADGRKLVFQAMDIPAGKAAMVFSVDNEKLLSTDACVDIVAEASCEAVTGADAVEVFADSITITLKNTSAEDLEQITVYYRDVFDDKYFGGMAYAHTIEKLTAGETVTITAEESLLGVIEVVRVAGNDKN